MSGQVSHEVDVRNACGGAHIQATMMSQIVVELKCAHHVTHKTSIANAETGEEYHHDANAYQKVL